MAEIRSLKKKSSSRRNQHHSQKILSAGTRRCRCNNSRGTRYELQGNRNECAFATLCTLSLSDYDVCATSYKMYEVWGTRYERSSPHFVLRSLLIARYEKYNVWASTKSKMRSTRHGETDPRTSYLVTRTFKTYVSRKPPWLHTRQAQVRCML